jgi:hypothetical protein
MQPFDAWHLPGLNTAELAFATYRYGNLDVRAPQLTASQVERVIDHITHARETVRAVPIADVVTAIDAAALAIAEDPNARNLLREVTGYSPETIEDILTHMVRDWSRDSLEGLLQAELGAAARPIGPRLAFHIFAGNVPGVAVTSVVRSLLVRAATLGKTAAGEPVLAVLFARALARAAPQIAETLAITHWPGGTEEPEAVALRRADVIIVYGGAETVSAIEARAPAGAHIVVHGPKLSIGLVGPEAGLEVAGPIARAVAAYDQQGCVSPHVVYVEQGGQLHARELACAIAAEMDRLAATLPRRAIDAAEAIEIRDARTRAEFRDNAEVFGPDETTYTIIYDEDVELTASCLNRTLYVKPIADLTTLQRVLEPHRGVLQSVAVAGFKREQIDAFAPLLGDVGVTRITTFERLPWPPMTWHHDGRGPLRELLIWQDIDV